MRRERRVYVRSVAIVEGLKCRPMVASDVGSVPIACQGNSGEVLARIADLGSSAMVVFDGDQRVGQLQFRRYQAGMRSPHGVWHPQYWMDFDNHAPELPLATMCVFCFHVGQLDSTAERDERYQGRGTGSWLLDCFLEWARAGAFDAVIAKATPPHRPVMGFLGGLPAAVYEEHGFEIVTRWVDADLARVVRERNLATDSEIEDASTVACCVHRLAR